MNLINIDLLVDGRNKDLWESMSNKFNITLQEAFNNEFGVYIPHNSNDVIIYINTINQNSSSFTHELLHLYLTTRQIIIYNSIKELIKPNKTLQQIFSLSLIEHISNIIEHTIMLPLYLNLGYKKEDFISDHNEPKCSKEDIQLISNNFKKGELYNYKCVDYYIGTFLAIKCDSNSNTNYTFCEKGFKNIDSFLYQILNDYSEQWNNYNFEKDVKGHVQIGINKSFIQQLDSWASNKKFISLL